MERSRIRLGPKKTYTARKDGVISDGPYTWSEELLEAFWESSYPGSCSCIHGKARLMHSNNCKRVRGDGYTYYVDYHNQTDLPSGAGLTAQQYLAYVLGPAYDDVSSQLYSFDWKELPTSSKFGIIQFLAELDDTIALFTTRFWKELSYGSFTWGVIPFVNDVKALLETISKLSANLDSLKYEKVTPIHSKGETSMAKWDVSGMAHHTGFLSYAQHANDAQVLLDRLGLHPDLATAWDLIPLSFLIDYILPVGNLLESISGRGWVDTLTFNGWTTYKLTIDREVKVHTPNSDWEPYSGIQVFIRQSSMQIVHNFRPVVLQPKLPNPTQLFNWFYVLQSRRR